jgi:hypothetical protein
MTTPDVTYNDVSFDEIEAANQRPSSSYSAEGVKNNYPPALLEMDKEKLDELRDWLDGWIDDLTATQADRQKEWAKIEQAYRALNGRSGDMPFVGHSTETIPVIAMAVEPVHARLETGIFSQDPVYRVKANRKSAQKYAPAVEKWTNFYFTKVIDFQRVASPRLLESAKLGTMAYKVTYQYERCYYKTYDEKNNIIEKESVKFRGPKPEGVEIGDLLFPAGYQHIQDVPIVAERQRTTQQELQKLEYTGFLTNVDKLANFGTYNRTDVEEARETSAQHSSMPRRREDIILHECWFHWQVDTSKPPVCLVATYHRDSQTFLQLRYNPYYHQKYPYVVVPYSIANQSIYGVGIGEMALPFQEALTQYHRMGMDNAYIANCRMFAAKRGVPGIGDRVTLYAGKTFYFDNPKEDFIPFQAGDIYPSTLDHQRNLFGLVEKRTGVSDYLTGRESPVLGSRATATSTLALIQEGTRRVEQVVGNVRRGFNEIQSMCYLLWAQYGLGDIDDYVFGDEDTGTLLDEFFKSVVNPANIETLLALDIAVTDATTNRQVQQQMQLSLIQLLTSYLQQVLQVGQMAIQAQAQGMAPLTEIVARVLDSGNKMYTDLVSKYDIPNADQYLPDVLSVIRGLQGGGGLPGTGPTGIPEQSPVAGPQSLLQLIGGTGANPTSQSSVFGRPAASGPGAGAVPAQSPSVG